jgi:NADPH2:quinone reductase
MASIQLAKRAGATVISTASSDEKLERLKTFGLDHGINYASESFVEQANELTEGRGVDVVVDSVGGQNLIDSVGVAGRDGSGIEAQALWRRNNSLRGVYLAGAIPLEYERIHAMIDDLLKRVAGGELEVEIDRTFPLAEAAACHEYIESRKAFGRVVMTP